MSTATPTRLGLDMTVFYTDPAVERKGFESDADGVFVSYMMAPMAGGAVCRVSLRRGMDPQEAALLLRKIADRIDAFGPRLLNLENGHLGHFNSDGSQADNLEPARESA